MAVNFYNTSLGPFPLIVSTSALNTVLSWGDTTPREVYNRGTLTTRGQALIDSGIFSGLTVPVLNNDGVTIPANNYNLFSGLGFVLNVINITGAGNTEQYFYDYDDNHENYLRIGYRRPTGDDNLQVNNTFISGSDSFTSLNHWLPFGGTGRISFTPSLCISVLVANDDMTAFGYAEILSANYTNNVILRCFPVTDASQLTALKNYFGNKKPVVEYTDPYSEGGESEPGGGDGNFDFTSTDIPIPGLPNIGAMSTGFLMAYHPSAAQLRSLASYLWSGPFDPDNFKKLFADPMDAILGLHIIPTISGHPATAAASLHVGNIDTEISMPGVTEQYYELDCGTVQIPAKWGAYLDYSPYSKLSLYLPYIGIVPISADDCMRGSITVKYHVDVLSGTCTAFVYCVSNRGADGHTLYTFTGSCSCECPITEGQYANALMAGLRVVGGIIGGSSGGTAGMVAGGIAEAANAAISMVKPDIGRSGSMGGSAGLMGIQYPYLILTVPRMATPGQQNTYIGYPSFVTKTMSECTGFTSIEVTHLEGVPATHDELEEIVGLLREGVIF